MTDLNLNVASWLWLFLRLEKYQVSWFLWEKEQYYSGWVQAMGRVETLVKKKKEKGVTFYSSFQLESEWGKTEHR